MRIYILKVEKKILLRLQEFTIKRCSLLQRDAVFSGRYLPTVWRKVLPVFSLSYPEIGCSTLPPKRW
jgi:hypothetical protein